MHLARGKLLSCLPTSYGYHDSTISQPWWLKVAMVEAHGWKGLATNKPPTMHPRKVLGLMGQSHGLENDHPPTATHMRHRM